LVVQVTIPPAVAAADTPVRSRQADVVADEPTEEAAEPLAEDRAAEAAVPPRFSLRIDVDLESGEARLELDPDSEPVRLVWRDGRWHVAPDS
ncbi:MAG: hypothetical protein QOJ55_2529, partial [Solirubrobacteraceae bacterium]|nr:hypothetical protein [Solirubrobacteraceae bacterium]